MVDTLGNVLAIVVHRANLHDTKAGIMAARLAVEKHPSIKAFCADAAYRKTFEADVASELGRSVDISEKIAPGWHIIPKRWKVERTFAWLNNYRRLSKDYEKKVASSQAMCTIASIAIMLRRF